ncbi:hypothetical protein D3C81_1323170 [compost metagenome]
MAALTFVFSAVPKVTVPLSALNETFALLTGAPLLSLTVILTLLPAIPLATLLSFVTNIVSITLLAGLAVKCPCCDALLSPACTVNVTIPAAVEVKSVVTCPLVSVTAWVFFSEAGASRAHTTLVFVTGLLLISERVARAWFVVFPSPTLLSLVIVSVILFTTTALNMLFWVAVTVPLFAVICTASCLVLVKLTEAVPSSLVTEALVTSLAVPVVDQMIGALRTG